MLLPDQLWAPLVRDGMFGCTADGMLFQSSFAVCSNVAENSSLVFEVVRITVWGTWYVVFTQLLCYSNSNLLST
jgi:hypothetical protein